MATLDKPNEYKVIGTSPLRHDGVDKVTGRAQYGADIRLPGMLYGAVLRSPNAHARILSIDTTKAEKLHGVYAVVTASDLPDLESKVVELGEGVVNRKYQSNNVLARDKVLYFGHAIAAVSANSLNIAQEALGLIQIEYEVLPPIMDVRQAAEPNAPILLDEVRTEEFGKKGDVPSNVAGHYQDKCGDIEKGFKDATVIVEREFTTTMVHQGYI